MTEKSNIHDEEALEKAVQKGGLFGVGPNEFDDDIGRHVRFPEAEADPENDSFYNYEHVIVAVQKDHEGHLCYRVQLAKDIPEMNADKDLGRVAPPDEVEFVDEATIPEMSSDRAPSELNVTTTNSPTPYPQNSAYARAGNFPTVDRVQGCLL